MKQPISSVFLLKALGALFVVMIHFHFYKSQFFEPLFRCGVPIFFIIGGYFLYTQEKDKLLKRVRRSLKKMVKWVVFFNVLYYLINSLFIKSFNFDITNATELLRLVVYGDAISGHLWFLNAYLWALLLMGLLTMLNLKSRVQNMLAVFFLILCCLEGSYGFILPFDIDMKKCWLPFLHLSFPMFVVGFNMRKYENKIVHMFNARFAALGVIVSVLLCYFEHRLFSLFHCYTADTKLSTLLLVSMLLVFSLTKKECGKGSWLETLGRDHSANIYFWQFVPSIVVCPIVTNLGLHEIELFVIFGVLIIWSYGVNYINSKIKTYLHC